MSIADYYESGESKENKGHFRNLVMLARVDGVVSPEEEELLKKIAKNIGLTDAQIEDVKNNPSAYPMNPPVSKEDRIERLIALIQMVAIDGLIEDSELALLEKSGVGLGFNEAQLNDLAPKIAIGIKDGKSNDEILEELV